jgi:hypothetical protein
MADRLFADLEPTELDRFVTTLDLVIGRLRDEGPARSDQR